MRLYLPNGLAKRAADAVDISDLTASVRTGEAYWDPDELDVLVIPMDRAPGPVQQEQIRRRLVTADAADEARLNDLLTARAEATTLFERLWLDTELAKYGETEAT